MLLHVMQPWVLFVGIVIIIRFGSSYIGGIGTKRPVMLCRMLH